MILHCVILSFTYFRWQFRHSIFFANCTKMFMISAQWIKPVPCNVYALQSLLICKHLLSIQTLLLGEYTSWRIIVHSRNMTKIGLTYWTLLKRNLLWTCNFSLSLDVSKSKGNFNQKHQCSTKLSSITFIYHLPLALKRNWIKETITIIFQHSIRITDI